MKSGYSGHVPRSFNTQEFVPGFSEQTKSKFSRAAVSMINSNAYGATTNCMASTNLKKSDYVVPTRIVAVSESGNNPPKRFVARTSNKSAYVNHMTELLKLENLSNGAIEAAFKTVDTDQSGFIDKREINNLLRRVFGTIPDPRMVASLTAHFDANKDGKISLCELAGGLRAVAVQKRSQMNAAPKGAPKWSADPTQMKKAVSNSVPMSMQRTDVGNYGTVRDLEYGTQKATNHLPGYSGFIPTATNTRAAEQSRADAPRPDKARLILNETYAPKIRVDKEMNYGSMQTINSKRSAAVNRMWKNNTKR